MEVYYNNHWITVTEKLLEWLLLEREIFQVRVKTQEKIYFSSKQKINVHLTGKLKKGMNKKKVFSTLSDNMTEMESTCCASNLEDTNFKNNETKSAKKIFKKRQKHISSISETQTQCFSTKIKSEIKPKKKILDILLSKPCLNKSLMYFEDFN